MRLRLRELTTYRSLLRVAEVVLADAEPIPTRLVRACIAVACTARVPAVARHHRHADAVKGGELSYRALALQREPTAYRSLLMRLRAVLADARPMLARQITSLRAERGATRR